MSESHVEALTAALGHIEDTRRGGAYPHLGRPSDQRRTAERILDTLSPEWMLVRKDESVWQALAADPAFQSGMAEAEADMAAGRTVKYELVPADRLRKLEAGCMGILEWLDEMPEAALGYIRASLPAKAAS